VNWLRPFVALSLILPSMSPNLPVVARAWAQVEGGATLTILAEPVEVAAAGATEFVPAQDGQAVHEGEVVRTGPGGLALLTFFDGSETQLAEETQVEIEQAHSEPERRVVLFQAAGVTVNRVQQLASGQVFETETPTALGVVRGTTYVVTVNRLDPPVSAPSPDSSLPAP
jgi:hypothetical protein